MTLLAKVTRLAFDTTSKLLGVQLRAEGNEADDATSASADEGSAHFFPQIGVAVRPVVARTLRALGIERGDEVVVLKLWDKSKSPTDLEVGETRLYACGDVAVRVRMKSDGLSVEAKGATITITSTGAVQVTAALGQDITLNSGLLKVARATDAVTVDAALVTTLGQIATLLNAPGPVVGAPGTVTPFTGPTVGTIAAAAGAPTVKA